MTFEIGDIVLYKNDPSRMRKVISLEEYSKRNLENGINPYIPNPYGESILFLSIICGPYLERGYTWGFSRFYTLFEKAKPKMSNVFIDNMNNIRL